MPERHDLQNILIEYNIEVKNKFNALNLVDREPDELWQEIKKVITHAAKDHIPKAKHRKRSPWLSAEAVAIANKRRELKNDGADKAEIQQANSAFQKLARRDKANFIAKTCTFLEAEGRAGRTREFFKKVKEITGKCTPRNGTLKSTCGKVLTEGAEIKSRWKEYTETLYKRDDNMQETFEVCDLEMEPEILESEVRKALNDVKNRKALGYDNIPVELVKEVGAEAIKVLTALCQQVWKTGVWPADWKKSVYIRMPKKGDSKACANYRTIALISHASKILLKIIQDRMESHITREISGTQAGFRKKRGT